MARTGRPPKNPDERKSEPVSIRLTPQLRARLDEARRTVSPERSLSEEVELRLRQSFEFDQKLTALFYGRRNFTVMQMSAQIMHDIERDTQKSLWEDAYTFGQCQAGIKTLFDYLKPRGRKRPPKVLPFRVTGRDTADALGVIAAKDAIVLYEAMAHRGEPAPLDYPLLNRAFAGAGTIAAQLAKSGRSALKERLKATTLDILSQKGKRQ
jgi:hypothetical protein